MCLRNDFLVCGTRTLLSYLLIVHMGYLLNLCFSINSGIPLYYNTEYFVSVSCPCGVSLPPLQHIP